MMNFLNKMFFPEDAKLAELEEGLESLKALIAENRRGMDDRSETRDRVRKVLTLAEPGPEADQLRAALDENIQADLRLEATILQVERELAAKESLHQAIKARK